MAAGTPTPPDTRASLLLKPASDLRALCASLHLPVGGSKPAIVERILHPELHKRHRAKKVPCAGRVDVDAILRASGVEHPRTANACLRAGIRTGHVAPNRKAGLELAAV